MPEKDVLLIIDFDKDGCAFVRTADKNGKQCIPDSNSFTGPLKTLLRSIEQIYKASQFSITWGENKEEGVSLADNRHLIYQLIECPNLCDCDLNPLIYDREKLWSLTLRLPGPDSPSHEFVLQNGDEYMARAVPLHSQLQESSQGVFQRKRARRLGGAGFRNPLAEHQFPDTPEQTDDSQYEP